MKARLILLSLTLYFAMTNPVIAQVWEVGANAGGAGYMGDLNQSNPIDVSGVAVGGFVKANLDSYWALGLHYNYGKIRGNDATSSNADFRDRNLNFSTPLNELSLQADFNFFDYFSGGGRKNFTPFLFAGVGGVFFNPKATYLGQQYELRFYQTEGKAYKNYALSIPFGAGVKYRVSDHFAFLCQAGYRIAHTDYLDDVGDKYPLVSVYGKTDAANPRLINLSDPSQVRTAAPGSQRGDYAGHDTYFFFHIGISYTFLSDKCFNF